MVRNNYTKLVLCSPVTAYAHTHMLAAGKYPMVECHIMIVLLGVTFEQFIQSCNKASKFHPLTILPVNFLYAYSTYQRTRVVLCFVQSVNMLRNSPGKNFPQSKRSRSSKKYFWRRFSLQYSTVDFLNSDVRKPVVVLTHEVCGYFSQA